MKYFSFVKQDVIVLFASVYPFMMIVDYLILGSAYFHLPLLFIATLVSWLVGTLSWVTHIVTANFMRERISSHTKMAKRVLIQLPVYVILTQLGICLATFLLFSALGLLKKELSWHSYRPLFFAGLLLNVIATSFHEGLLLFENWKLSLYETDRLKKSNLQSQLDGLKNQVNPHFLFNSLNALSSLIDTDAGRAGEFVDEMSKVYRYLLRSNECDLIPLSSELKFVHSFFHMLKTRYGNHIQLAINVSAEFYDFLIPPLTLQLLLENAVKHNVILKEKPLCIQINAEMGYLTVSNNYQEKITRVASNRIGLQNINTKYRLLGQPEIIIRHTADVFSVSLPLIPPHYESTDH